jgi:NADH:ubiquinone oxidoreductase subunit 3 (subunit A)
MRLLDEYVYVNAWILFAWAMFSTHSGYLPVLAGIGLLAVSFSGIAYTAQKQKRYQEND